MVRLRLPSGETLCSEPFPVYRGVIQGDIFSPQCFTLGLDRIFRLHDIAGQGIGGPSLGDVTASKLEYADDVGLLDWTATEASERVSALASGSRHPRRWRCRRPSRRACMCMSGSVYQCRRKWRLRPLTYHTAAPNARRRFRRHVDWRCTELVGAARDNALPPDGGQLADKAVKLVKRQASAALLQPVVMEGESLETVYQFDYLGCRFTSDGDDAADMRHRMAIAGERSRSLAWIRPPSKYDVRLNNTA